MKDLHRLSFRTRLRSIIQPGRLALLLSILAVLASAWVTVNIFEGVPHIEDEFAYVWQARLIASGKIKLPSPPEPHSFLVPFVVDHNGWRFGKYPIGWPLLLALGIRFGLRGWINPFLAGVGVWLTYRLGCRLVSEKVGLLAALLTATSPFVLMNSGSLLSHAFGLVLSSAFVLGWLEAFTVPEVKRRWAPALLSGFALGLLALSRPFTALAVAVPFGLHGLYLWWRSDRETRLRLVGIGLLAGCVASLHLLWQYLATGDPFLNTYTLWWPYDMIGFGPGIGATQTGHDLSKAWLGIKVSLGSGAVDIFGWAGFSYVLVPFGFWALRRSLKGWLVGSVFFSLVVAYLFYWVGAWLFGPRYYYEGLFSLTLLSAAGIAWLGGFIEGGDKKPDKQSGNPWAKIRRLGSVAVISLFLGTNVLFYLPLRLQSMYRLFGIGASELVPFQSESAASMAPALVFVDSERWMGYTIYTELETPDLTSPFIFAWSIGPRTDARVIGHFPDRSIFYYYPDEPGQFYPEPR